MMANDVNVFPETFSDTIKGAKNGVYKRNF